MTPIAGPDHGQTSVEYVAVMLLSAIVLVLALTAGVGGLLDNLHDTFISALP